MGGVHLHPNEEVHERSKSNIVRYYEIIEGKTALLQTWEARGTHVLDQEHEYILELKTKIRRARVLLSHIKP